MGGHTHGPLLHLNIEQIECPVLIQKHSLFLSLVNYQARNEAPTGDQGCDIMLIGQAYHTLQELGTRNFGGMMFGMGALKYLKKNLHQSHLVRHKFYIITGLYKEVHPSVYNLFIE
jgi:hypothetical protein